MGCARLLTGESELFLFVEKQNAQLLAPSLPLVTPFPGLPTSQD